MARIFASLLAVLATMTIFSSFGHWLNLLTVGLALLMIWQKKLWRFLVPTVLLILIVGAIGTGLLEGGAIRRQLGTPLPAEYTTDMRAFLKTVQLMKNGQSFYTAFPTSMAGLRSGHFQPDVNAWRQPLIFYVWKFLPGNGESIYWFWQIVIIANLIAAFHLAKKFLPTNFAILSPLLLWPYFHYSLVDLTILQPEWWAASFFLIGLVFFIYKRPGWAAIFWAVTLAVREPFALPIGLIVILNRQFRPKMWLPFLLFIVYYLGIHLQTIFSLGTEAFRSTRNGGWYVIHSLFAYSSWNYRLGIWRPFWLLLLDVLAVGWIRKRPAILWLSFLPLFLLAAGLAVFGLIDETRDYWGIYFVPLLLVTAPIFILPPGKK